MSLEIALILAAIVVLIALSAFFNVSETALTAASRARMHALEQDGNARAKLVNRILHSPEKMIGTILIGNTLVDVLASALASGLGIVLIGEVGVVYATAIMTLLIVIFAAVLPKTYALAYSDRVRAAGGADDAGDDCDSLSGDRRDRVHRAAASEAHADQSRRRG